MTLGSSKNLLLDPGNPESEFKSISSFRVIFLTTLKHQFFDSLLRQGMPEVEWVAKKRTVLALRKVESVRYSGCGKG